MSLVVRGAQLSIRAVFRVRAVFSRVWRVMRLAIRRRVATADTSRWLHFALLMM
jgi:hypothetical protein